MTFTERLDQVWECPRCGAQAAASGQATLVTPKCALGHRATEMEQKAIEAFRPGQEVDDA